MSPLHVARGGADQPRTRVLYIGGEGRSGSTILERLITDNPGVCGIGEVKWLFGMGVGNRELCGCGRLVVDCPLWKEIGVRLAGGWETPAGSDLVAFFRDVNHVRNLPIILSGRGGMVTRARRVLGEMYPAIAELTGADVVVDSSKHPSWAFLLAGLENIDLRIVHLVRHPSAVVYSWSAPVARPHAASSASWRFMPAHRSWEVAIRWDIFNALFHRLEQRGVPTLRIRYEDYVEDLKGVVEECLRFAGIDRGPVPGRTIDEHGIAGNPSRFAPAGTTINRDDRWVEGLGENRHAMVSAITWPIRMRYGYRADRQRFFGPPGPSITGGVVDHHRGEPAAEGVPGPGAPGSG
jgi:Sulfotransferase domain